ncbi:MAG: exosome complex RNA-binding protein Rrp4 [Candidatus Nanoarchaeia archaeon]
MGELLANDKDIVVPGQVIAKGLDFLPSQGTYRLNENIIANRVGLLSVEGKVLKTLQLSGRYLPQRNDIIIGKVDDILMSGWRFDINAPYSAVLPLKDASFDFIAKGVDLSRYFNLDDYAVLKITNVTSQNLVDVTAKGAGLKRLRGGAIVKVNPQKVPRIIGKKGTMVSLIKRATDCKIIVGQNGLVWIDGEPEMEVLAVSAIRKVEEQSHLQGVTESVKKFLEEKIGREIPEEPEHEEHNGDFVPDDRNENNQNSEGFDDSHFERPQMNDAEGGDLGDGNGSNGAEHHHNGGGYRGNFQRPNNNFRNNNGGGRPPFRSHNDRR